MFIAFSSWSFKVLKNSFLSLCTLFSLQEDKKKKQKAKEEKDSGGAGAETDPLLKGCGLLEDSEETCSMPQSGVKDLLESNTWQ